MLEKIKAFNSMDLIEQIEAIKSIITDTNYLFLVDKNEEKCFIFLDDEKKNPTILFSQTNKEYPIFGVVILGIEERVGYFSKEGKGDERLDL